MRITEVDTSPAHAMPVSQAAAKEINAPADWGLISQLMSNLDSVKATAEPLTRQEKHSKAREMVSHYMTGVFRVAEMDMPLTQKVFSYYLNGSEFREACEALIEQNQSETPDDQAIPVALEMARQGVYQFVDKDLPKNIPPEIRNRVLGNFR